MKAADFIKVVRNDLQELLEMHELSVATNGKQGCRCLNPEILYQKIRQSDREILEHYLAKGAVIDDAEEYLAGQKV